MVERTKTLKKLKENVFFLSILRASVKKLGLHEIFYVEKLHFPMAYSSHDELMT